MEHTFKYTDEQLQAIYNGDMDARNTFYFDNLEIIQRMAHCAVRRENHPTVTAEDLVQGVYVDMGYFCWAVNCPVTNEVEIRFFLRWSFHLAPYGGLAYCRENNPKITCKRAGIYDTTYTDPCAMLRLDAIVGEDDEKINAGFSVDYSEYIADPRAKQALEDTTDYTEQYVNTFGQFLTAQQRDVFARIMDGYTDTQIAEQLGIRLGAASSRRRRLRDTFDKHRADVLATLESYGIYAEKIADSQPATRFYKTSEKQRATMARYLQRKRERKLAESNGNDVA